MTGKTVWREIPLVLVVDDDPTIRLLVRESLEQSGFSVVEVESGLEALAAFAEYRPDVLLLDVMLPGLDGFSVCARIRELPGGAGTPILMMTGLDDIESIQRAYETGATDFITKPINWVILGHRVQYMLRTSRAVDKLRTSEARLAHAQRIAQLGSWEWDIVSDELIWSDEVYRIFNVDPAGFDMSYHAFLNNVHPLDREFVNSSMEDALYRHKPYSIDHRIVLAGGNERIVHTEAEVTYGEDGRAVWMAGTVQDITERRHTEERIRFLAYYDNLTCLPNRIMFKERLEYVLSIAQRHARKVATLFLDLDRFKCINDTLGHGVGDKLLQGVADRLLAVVRKHDVLSHDEPTSDVSRLGGDEFTVLLSDIVNAQDVTRIARRILDAVAQPFVLDGHEVRVTTSIGISLFPDDGDNVVDLVKNADTAMYHAKELGRNNFQFYTESMNASAYQRLVLENQLRKALERNEFVLYYQPQVEISSGSIIGVEALLRWRNPERGMVFPNEFITLAEETGLIIQIDEWVMAEACRQSREWQEAGYPGVRIGVNLSAQHFLQKNLLTHVANNLEISGMDPRNLVLELTEGVLMGTSLETVQTLEQLKEMGVRLSIDDFGTGYSSLSYLKRFPIDTLKIDRSFVREITGDSDSAAITTAIIAMARSLKLRVVAEGVETEAQLEFLRDNGCDAMQGFLHSRPQSVAEVTRLFTASPPVST